MRRKFICAVILSAMVCAASSCGGSTTGNTSAAQTESPSVTEQAPAADFKAADVTEAVLAEIPINSAFEKNKESLEDYFDDLNTDAITDFSYYICASGAYPDEIAVFRFDTEDSAKSAVSSVQDRLSYQIEVYETYTPDEFYKLQNAVIKQSGEWVYYLVTSDNEKADTIVQGFIK